jgi:hypothetical protein
MNVQLIVLSKDGFPEASSGLAVPRHDDFYTRFLLQKNILKSLLNI